MLQEEWHTMYFTIHENRYISRLKLFILAHFEILNIYTPNEISRIKIKFTLYIKEKCWHKNVPMHVKL